MFHREPAWRKTSIGPIAVDENIWSRSRTVISLMAAPRNHSIPVGVKTYLQWHICHLVASTFHRYFESSNLVGSKKIKERVGQTYMATAQKLARIINGVKVNDLFTT